MAETNGGHMPDIGGGRDVAQPREMQTEVDEAASFTVGKRAREAATWNMLRSKEGLFLLEN